MESTSITPSHILKFALIFFLFISNMEKSSSSITTTNTTKSLTNTYKKYLKTACNSTTYPKLCYTSLSSYSSTIKTNYLTLCTTALNISLQVSYNTSSLVTLLSKQQGLSNTVQDCIEEIEDSIDELNQSLDAFGSIKLNGSDVRFQISNIQTWVSAALTNEDTCSDEIDDDASVSSSIKKKIKKSILNVARITSIALALINKLPY